MNRERSTIQMSIKVVRHVVVGMVMVICVIIAFAP